MKTVVAISSRIVSLAILCASFSLHAKSIDYAALYEQVSDSVVTVNTQTIRATESGIAIEPGVGSGILLEPTLIMTAAHVVDGVDTISVQFKDGVSITGRVVTTVDLSDTGLIMLSRPHPSVAPVKLGDSDQVKIGSDVFIIGAPYGIKQTLSVGIVSGRMNRGQLEDGTDIEFLQTDSAINPGNSGGPMFNTDGEVIGIVSFILSSGGGFDGVGFATAINSAEHSVFQSSGFVAGFDGIVLSEEVQRALGVGQDALLVQHVVEGSMADSFGLKAGSIPAQIANVNLKLGGDIIVDVGCQMCTVSMSSVRSIAQSLGGNQATTITVIRNGKTVVLSREEPASSQTVAVLYRVHAEH